MPSITFETDYAFRPTPAGFMGIPEQYHAGLRDGSLQLVLRRCVTPNRWTIVQAVDNPDASTPWPLDTIVDRLDERPDLMFFTERDWSRASVDYGPAMAAYIPMATTNAFADAGKPLWTRYEVSASKTEKHLKRHEKAVKCAASFNEHAGRAPCAVTELSNEALAVLCLQRDWRGESWPVWMHRSLADAVLQAVRAGHATVMVDGSVQSDPEAITQAQIEWARRKLEVTWTEPLHIQKRIEALESHPNRRLTKFKGKYPDTLYSMRDL